jgi:hypothetical protein
VAKSIFDIPSDAAKETHPDAEAEADFAMGRIIPCDVVGDWLLSLPKGQAVYAQITDGRR